MITQRKQSLTEKLPMLEDLKYSELQKYIMTTLSFQKYLGIWYFLWTFEIIRFISYFIRKIIMMSCNWSQIYCCHKPTM